MLLAAVLALAAQTAPAPLPRPDARPPATSNALTPRVTFATQAGAGCAACCGATVLAAIPGYGLSLIPVAGGVLDAVASEVIVGTAVGVTEGTIGDVFGPQRAALAWPVLAATLAVGATVAAQREVAITLFRFGLIDRHGKPKGDDADFLLGVSLSELALFAVEGVVVSLVPALVYAAVAVDKAPGDTGLGWPGVFAPARPQAPGAAKPVVVGMVY